MIDNQVINQLERGTPAERKQAIKTLAQSQDPGALHYLAVVYQTDTDPKIRELAYKAGIYIRKHSRPGNSASQAYTPPAAKDGSGGREVSTEDREWAEQYISRALDRHVHGDREFAIRNMIRAFDRNPDLLNDSEAREVASNITDLPPQEAIDHILDEAEKLKKSGGKRKNVPLSDDSYKGVLLSLALYALSNIIIVGIGFFGGYALLASSVTEVMSDPAIEESIAAGTALDPATILGAINVAGLSAIAGYVAITGVISVFSLLFQYFTIHAASTLMLGGDGTMPRLIRSLTPYLALINPAFIVMAVLMVFLQTDNALLGSIVRLIPVVFTFGAVYLVAHRISLAYRYGIGNGCVAMVLSNVLLLFFLCGCNFLSALLVVGAANGA